ncbi:endospore germination permease [Paenibacillus aurantius]|uniref:Endospore germination permease n=1 Tax=Paenibacillus aurantius TaxID=2918900 RepID=A0AA96LFW5_9BACL|nr:endospore germination permease [Paenibacillus aurantius]WNQ12555.1 endospore germination permease [Paenibacillus aurantius]
MKKYALNEITLMQYIFLIQGAQVGTGMLSLPRVLAEKSGTDGWIVILFGGIINFASGWIILLTLRKYPDFTLPDLFKYLFGKWLGKLFLLPLIAYFASYGWVIIANSMLFIKAWFLPKTPEYWIVLLFAIPGYLIVRHGLRVLARYAELVFYMMLLTPLIFLLTLEYGHWIHLLPLFKEGWEPIITGVKKTVFAFAGNEILFFVYPFLKKKQYAVHGLLIANTLTILLYLYVTVICFVFYTPDGITSLNQPVLSLLKTIEFRFLERVDMIFLAIYLFVVSRAWSAYIYCTVFSTCHLLRKQDHSSHTFIYFIVAIGCAYVVKPTWNQADQWVTLLSNAGMVVLYVLPVLLLVYASGFEKYRRWRAG